MERTVSLLCMAIFEANWNGRVFERQCRRTKHSSVLALPLIQSMTRRVAFCSGVRSSERAGGPHFFDVNQEMNLVGAIIGSHLSANRRPDKAYALVELSYYRPMTHFLCSGIISFNFRKLRKSSLVLRRFPVRLKRASF